MDIAGKKQVNTSRQIRDGEVDTMKEYVKTTNEVGPIFKSNIKVTIL